MTKQVLSYPACCLANQFSLDRFIILSLHHQRSAISPLLVSTTYTMAERPRKSFRNSFRSLISSKDRSVSSSGPASPVPADSTIVSHAISADERGNIQSPKSSRLSLPFRGLRSKRTSTLSSRPSSPNPGVDTHHQHPTIHSGSDRSDHQAVIITPPTDHISTGNDPITYVSS